MIYYNDLYGFSPNQEASPAVYDPYQPKNIPYDNNKLHHKSLNESELDPESSSDDENGDSEGKLEMQSKIDHLQLLLGMRTELSQSKQALTDLQKFKQKINNSKSLRAKSTLANEAEMQIQGQEECGICL